jgi:ankyrin repeat protein
MRVEDAFAPSTNATIPPAKIPQSSSKATPRNQRETRKMGKKLREAASVGDAKKLIELLSHDDGYAVVNDPDADTRTTPLHLACLSGSADCVTLLCGAGAALETTSVYGSPLHCAAQTGRLDIVKALLDAGAKKDATTGNVVKIL